MNATSSTSLAAIAVVEDHDDLRAELAFQLGCNGYAVTALADGAALDAHLACHPCHLIVLDLGLPGEDGLSICARLRASRPEIGIVMLTARGLALDRLNGLQGGADAYLVKPTSPQELQAVIANLLRRLRVAAPAPAASGWCFDPRRQSLAAPGGATVTLTHAESLLLQALQRAAPQPASRHELVQALGGNYLDFTDHRLEMAISRLRRKLEQIGPDAEPIRAARGAGYRLTIPCTLRE